MDFLVDARSPSDVEVKFYFAGTSLPKEENKRKQSESCCNKSKLNSKQSEINFEI